MHKIELLAPGKPSTSHDCHSPFPNIALYMHAYIDTQLCVIPRVVIRIRGESFMPKQKCSGVTHT